MLTPAGVAPGSSPGVRLPTVLAATVRAGAAGYDWSAAVIGRRAADLQLTSGVPVWSVGGYNGSDPHPTLPEFVAAVAAHRVHYLAFVGAPVGGSSPAAEIGRWAVQHGSVQRLGEWSLVDLSGPSSAPPFL